MITNTSLISLLCIVNSDANSQELEPRAYSALPKNLNTIVAAYALSKGNVLTDPSLPVNGLSITINSLTAGYLRTFGLGTKLARVQVSIPLVLVSGNVLLNGSDTNVSRSGFGDARIRLGINLTGTPVLDKKDFTHYTQKTIIGVSLVTTIPTGFYLKDKYINIGSNRWAFKPEVGMSKRINRVYVETYSGVWFYTDNKKYVGNKTLKQKPVFNFQAHGCYFFKNRMMISLNTTWFSGGKTEVNEVAAGTLLNNWRVGATWALPIAKGQSLKLQFHVGAYTTVGYDYNVAVLSYQYVF